MSNVRTVSFRTLNDVLLVKFVPRGSGSWWSLFGGLVVSSVCMFLPMLVSSVPRENSISVLKIEDPEVRSNEMKELGGLFTLIVKMSFCLVYCEWHFPQLFFSPRFKLLPSMKVSGDLVHFPYSYRPKPNEPVPVPSFSCRDCPLPYYISFSAVCFSHCRENGEGF